MVFICSLGFYFFGEDNYQGYSFNFGKALIWPISLCKQYPRINASCAAQFAESYRQVEASGGPIFQTQFNTSVGLVCYYCFYQTHKDLDKSYVQRVLGNEQDVKAFIATLVNNDELKMDVAHYLDGMTFGDIVRLLPGIEDQIRHSCLHTAYPHQQDERQHLVTH